VAAQLQLQRSSFWLIAPDLRRGFFRANFFRHPGWSSRPNRPSADLYELFSKVSALQQPKECFWHVFDPLKHIFFEGELPRSLPIGKTLQSFTPSVPPVEYQKSVDTGARDDEMTHEPFANVSLPN
jgi:hypothetical protein